MLIDLYVWKYKISQNNLTFPKGHAILIRYVFAGKLLKGDEASMTQEERLNGLGGSGFAEYYENGTWKRKGNNP